MEEKFIEELKALFEKYGISFSEDVYEDANCRAFWISGKDIYFGVNDLRDLFEKLSVIKFKHDPI